MTTYLRDVLNIPDSVLAGDFKVELSGGFDESEQLVGEYVVTDQLEKSLRQALGIIKTSAVTGKSNAAYLHGSFGSGKSHFLTVLHAIVNGSPAAAAKPRLQPLLADNADWLGSKKFLMVPYHLVGAESLDSSLLGGYVATVRKLHPDALTPAVYRDDSALADARRLREALGDEKFIASLVGGTDSEAPLPADDLDDDLGDLDAVSGWTPDTLDAAFAAPPGDPLRDGLITGLISEGGLLSAYARGAQGDAGAFLPLENGLAVISRHAHHLGYDGLILFLDELILWLQARLADRSFVNNEVSKLVKLIESGDTDRPLPIVSLISRQRDLSQLIGSDVVGADAKNLEQQVGYLAGRFDVVSLEDRNLPAIIKERVLKPTDPQALADAFADIESSDQGVREVLLDAAGATHADWQDFKELYPLSPVLLNTLVALSGALQRERTGLKLIQEMLYRRRNDMRLGELIPLGDLWDVLSDGMGEAFTDRLRAQSEAAIRFHIKVQGYLREKYGSADDPNYRADDRFIKTLLLGFLSPEVPALARLTGQRLAALNHGSLRSRAVSTADLVIRRMRDIQAQFPGELRTDGNEADPVFTLHLSDLDVEPILDAVGERDTVGARRIWIKDRLWEALGVQDSGAFVTEKEIVWRGSRRVAEFVYDNVKDQHTLPNSQFRPSVDGRVRFVLDYPFDETGGKVSDDTARVRELKGQRVEVPTLVWLPFHFSPQRSAQLGRLLKIEYLLQHDRLATYATHLSSDDQIRVRHQLEAQRDTLTTQLVEVLKQLYGVNKLDEGNAGEETPDGRHVYSLLPDHTPRMQGGADFSYNLAKLADGVFAALYPKHPDFDPSESRKPVTTGELKTVYSWIAKAMDDGSRRVVVDSRQLALVKRIVHPLELGEVHDGPLNVGVEWRKRIEQHAGKLSDRDAHDDFDVEEIRRWIAELGWTGLDKQVSNLLIAVYALVADRSWVYNGSPASTPELDRIGPGWALRAQGLPSEEEFALAHARAAALFGTNVPQVRYARNVNSLATQAREKAQGWEGAVNGLRRSLDKHRTALCPNPSSAGRTPREVSVAEAADLLARLVRLGDPTKLVRELAQASYTTADDVLARAMSSAEATLGALDRTDWELLGSVREFTARRDGLADRTERLLARIAEAAAAPERERELGTVLGEADRECRRIVREAARLTAVAPPPPAPAAPEEPAALGSAHEVSLTLHAEPLLPSEPLPTPVPAPRPTTAPHPSARPRGLVIAANADRTQLAQLLSDLTDELHAKAAGRPRARFRVELVELVDLDDPEGGE